MRQRKISDCSWIFMALVVISVGSSCQHQGKERELRYFDVQQFMDGEAEKLAELHPQLVKTFYIDGEKNTQQMPVNDSLWKDEFRIFKEHDINKPVLLDAYEITSGVSESGNPFTLYSLKDGEQSGVTFMKITYIDSVNVKLWESQYREHNPLYSGERYVNMKLGYGKSGYQVMNYGIRGFHKLLLRDTVRYQMQATVQY